MKEIFYYWLSLSLIFFILEILTPGIFFFSFLGIGALIAMIVSFYNSSIIVQSLVFVTTAVLMIYFLKPLLSKYFVSKGLPSNVDNLIFKEGIVVEDIFGNKNSGLVKVNNELWRAFSLNNELISKGEEIVVERIEGTHLIVRKKV